MNRSLFLTIVAAIATIIGSICLFTPEMLIVEVKHAIPSSAANVMARTVGILLVSIAILNFLVRNHEDSQTIKAILKANLVLQLGIMPIDPLAYAYGIYATTSSFLPNTILHILLAAGFTYFILRMEPLQQKI